MLINGQEKGFELKIERDKITLCTTNDVAEMNLKEAEAVCNLILDQVKIMREAIIRNG